MSVFEEPVGAFAPEIVSSLDEAGLTDPVVATALTGDLAGLDSINTVDDLVKAIDISRSTLQSRIGVEANARMTLVYAGLSDAVATGEVLPGEAAASTGYVFASGGAKILAGTVAALTLIDQLYRDWAIKQGHAIHHPITTARPVRRPGTSAVHPALAVGVTVPEPNTPGGRIVTQAEKGLKSLRINAPGLSTTTAKAISVAISEAYKDTLTVIVGSLNHVEAQIAGAQFEIGRLQGNVGTLAKVAGTVPTSVTTQLSSIESTLKRIERGMKTLDTRIGNTEKAVEHISRQPVVTTAPPAPVSTPGLSPTETQALATIPTLATTSAVTAASLEASAAMKLAEQNAAVLGDMYVPNLPNSIMTLEDCCAANSEVTQPIKGGGATPSLLSKLGGLLVKAYALAIVASAVDIVLAILDAPDVLLGEMRTVSWIAPIAEAAAKGALADLAWTGELTARV